MTKVELSSYDDLSGDAILHSRGKDRVFQELVDGANAVLWMDDWLPEKKTLDPLGDVAGLEQLFVGRLVAETEKAFLFTQIDADDPDADAPGTDWVPKSATRLYVADEIDASTSPQHGLDSFG